MTLTAAHDNFKNKQPKWALSTNSYILGGRRVLHLTSEEGPLLLLLLLLLPTWAPFAVRSIDLFSLSEKETPTHSFVHHRLI